jgi:hypothetical protein
MPHLAPVFLGRSAQQSAYQTPSELPDVPKRPLDFCTFCLMGLADWGGF